MSSNKPNTPAEAAAEVFRNAHGFPDKSLFQRNVHQEEQKPKGLGDTIANMTKKVGIKPCGGCKKRQEKLNEVFPYKPK
jgi:hypothetical protein